ncbi:MAG: outer membrane protein assembly factor BamD [Deltaproteobacteria bacterium]|nr:MAG: outer membrane protein assembly factor BamD [Deltaproteobacteria bacterium]
MRSPPPTLPTLVLSLLVLLAALSPVSAEAAPRRRGKEMTVQEQYELGLRYLKRGNYQKALESFNRIRNYHRDDPLAIKAELAVADAYYRKSEWDQARLTYEDFMRMHPRHPDLDYVVYRIGLCLYRKAPKVAARDQTWTRQAVNTWAGFEGRFPSSEYREEVARRYAECRERLARKELLIARFYKRRKAWRAVAGRAGGLVRSYPDSEAARTEGWLLLAEASARQGDMATEQEALLELESVDPDAADRLRERLDRVRPDAE